MKPLALILNVRFTKSKRRCSFGWTTLNRNLFKASQPGILKTILADDRFLSLKDITKLSTEKPKFARPTSCKGDNEPLMHTCLVSLSTKSRISGTGNLWLLDICMVSLVPSGQGNWREKRRPPIVASPCCTPDLSCQMFTSSMFSFRTACFTSDREENCFSLMERQLKMQATYKGKTSQLILTNCPSV